MSEATVQTPAPRKSGKRPAGEKNSTVENLLNYPAWANSSTILEASFDNQTYQAENVYHTWKHHSTTKPIWQKSSLHLEASFDNQTHQAEKFITPGSIIQQPYLSGRKVHYTWKHHSTTKPSRQKTFITPGSIIRQPNLSGRKRSSHLEASFDNQTYQAINVHHIWKHHSTNKPIRQKTFITSDVLYH